MSSLNTPAQLLGIPNLKPKSKSKSIRDELDQQLSQPGIWHKVSAHEQNLQLPTLEPIDSASYPPRLIRYVFTKNKDSAEVVAIAKSITQPHIWLGLAGMK